MSSDSVGWAFGHSPYQGATFAVHLAIADSVNDQNGNEFWMSVARLAIKARCERRTASRGISTLISDGFLTCLEERTGKPTRYRFEFPSVEPVYNTRPGQPETPEPGSSQPGSSEPRTSTTPRTDDPGHPRPRPGSSRPTNPREPKQELQPKQQLPEAHALAKLAWEQTPRPISPFMAVKARCQEALDAGFSFKRIQQVIEEGDITWTRSALEYRLGQGKSKNGSRSSWLDRPGKTPLAERVAATLGTGSLAVGDGR